MRTWLYHKVLPAGKIFDAHEVTQELIDAGWVDSPEGLNEPNRENGDAPRGDTPETVRRHRGEDDNRSGTEPDRQGDQPGGSPTDAPKRPARSAGRPKKESPVDSNPGRNSLLSPSRHVV